MTAHRPSRDHIPHAHLLRAVLDGHYLQWFCRDATAWKPFATQTDALCALLSNDGALVRITPAADTAVGAAETHMVAFPGAHLMPPTPHLTRWPRHMQTVYRADPDGPTGSEPVIWKGSSEQRLYFERCVLYADEYSAMAAWRAKHRAHATGSNVIYCEFDKSLLLAPATSEPEEHPVRESTIAAVAM